MKFVISALLLSCFFLLSACDLGATREINTLEIKISTKDFLPIIINNVQSNNNQFSLTPCDTLASECTIQIEQTLYDNIEFDASLYNKNTVIAWIKTKIIPSDTVIKLKLSTSNYYDNYYWAEGENAAIDLNAIGGVMSNLSCKPYNLDCYEDTRDYKTYRTKTFNNLIWFTENLNYKNIEFGSKCYGAKTDDDQSDNNGDPLACFAQGRLYNYQAAHTACPYGWRLPYDREWTELEGYAGSIAINSVDRGSPASALRKESGLWEVNFPSSNSTGFNVIPGGLASNGEFLAQHTEAHFWTGDHQEITLNTDSAYARIITMTSNTVNRLFQHTSQELSVRCVKEID